MQKTTEVPDITIPGQMGWDKLDITIRKQEVLFNASVDSAGSEFSIPKKKLRELFDDEDDDWEEDDDEWLE